jgi:hypothetical protein
MRSPGAQAYAILNLCRTLHAVRMGEPASKRRGAEWALAELPEWSPSIRRALQRDCEPESHGETVRFVLEARRRILEAP